MPQIIVTADHGQTIMHRERVNVTDFESDHFAAQLVERIGWAVSDAAQVENLESPADDTVRSERLADTLASQAPERVLTTAS